MSSPPRLAQSPPAPPPPKTPLSAGAAAPCRPVARFRLPEGRAAPCPNARGEGGPLTLPPLPPHSSPRASGIKRIGNFQGFTNLEVLWLNDNALEEVTGLDQNFRIKELALQNNRILTLKGSLKHFKFLTLLDLENNNLRDLHEVLAHLEHFQSLKTLTLRGNPCCHDTKDYRLHVVHRVPWLHLLDYTAVTERERQEARRLFRVTGSNLGLAFGKRAPPDDGPWKTLVPAVSPLMREMQQRLRREDEEGRRREAGRDPYSTDPPPSGQSQRGSSRGSRAGAGVGGLRDRPRDYVVTSQWVPDESKVQLYPAPADNGGPISMLPGTLERMHQNQLSKAPLKQVKQKVYL